MVAQDAEEGLGLAQSFLPDGIVLDMFLPDQSGLTVLDQLKENSKTRHIPVCIASAHDYMERALQMGAIGYVLKPAKREELKAAFGKIESRLSQKTKRVLIVEDDKLQRESMAKLISGPDIEITAVASAKEALEALKPGVFDCMVMDLRLPDMPGEELLKKMTEQFGNEAFPPVIVYTGRSLSRNEEDQLRKYSGSIIIKGAKSPDRLLDEVSLFLHSAESKFSPERRQVLESMRRRDDVFEGRKILVVDDDVRNIFALTAALEQKGRSHRSRAKRQGSACEAQRKSPYGSRTHGHHDARDGRLSGHPRNQKTEALRQTSHHCRDRQSHEKRSGAVHGGRRQ